MSYLWVNDGEGRMVKISTDGFASDLAAYEAMWNGDNEPVEIGADGSGRNQTLAFDENGKLISDSLVMTNLFASIPGMTEGPSFGSKPEHEVTVTSAGDCRPAPAEKVALDHRSLRLGIDVTEGTAFDKILQLANMYDKMQTVVDGIQKYRKVDRKAVLIGAIVDTMNPSGTAVNLALNVKTMMDNGIVKTITSEFTRKLMGVIRSGKI